MSILRWINHYGLTSNFAQNYFFKATDISPASLALFLIKAIFVESDRPAVIFSISPSKKGVTDLPEIPNFFAFEIDFAM